MAIDWEAEVGAPNVAVFGGTARYYPADGSPAFDLIGVADEGFREVVIVDSLSYTSDASPVIGVNSAQFALNNWTPQQNDKVKITDPLSKMFGQSFIVKEPRPDSHGIILLILNEYETPLP